MLHPKLFDLTKKNKQLMADQVWLIRFKNFDQDLFIYW